MNTEISVILPVYNGGKLLVDSVKSVLAQDFNEFEFLICDDYSTDESYDKLQELVGEYKHVKLFKNDKNLGLFKTLNKLMFLANSNLIHLWSQDDIMKSNCLSSTVKFHQKYPQIGMSYSARDLIDGDNEIIKPYPNDETPEFIDKELYSKISIYWGCIAGNIANVTILKDAFYKVGDFNEAMSVSGDFDYWTRIAKQFPIGFNKDSNIYLRVHPNQLSHKFSSVSSRIKEDIIINKMLLDMIAPNFRKKAYKCWEWKTQTMFFNEIIFLFRHQQLNLAKESLKDLMKVTSVFSVFIRWAIIKVMRLLKLEKWFYRSVIQTLT